MQGPIAGVLPVVHTPFREDESIDHESLARQIDWAFEQGADGYCTGMVSELSRLSTQEHIELNRALAERKADRGVFIAGVGAESTRLALEHARAAADAGCDGIMAIPPTSTALPPGQLLGYFRSLAEQVDLPLVVQDASSYVGQPIPLEVCVQLQAGLDGFLAIEKYVLAKRGLFATSVRRKPYAWEMDEETRRELERMLAQLDAAIQRVTEKRSSEAPSNMERHQPGSR